MCQNLPAHELLIINKGSQCCKEHCAKLIFEVKPGDNKILKIFDFEIHLEILSSWTLTIHKEKEVIETLMIFDYLLHNSSLDTVLQN